MSPRRTNAQMSDSTRKELIRRAREAFAEHGYAHAPIEDVVKACGLTRGALYHHFGSKQGLFLAVVQQIDDELLERVTAAEAAVASEAGPSTFGGRQRPVAQFLVACRAYLEATLDPGVRRILIIDAPAVLATLPDQAEATAAVEASLAPLREGLAQLRDAGALRELDLAVTSRMLGGALFEAAAWAGAAAKPRKALDAALASLALIVDGLTHPAIPARRR
jgi:AcrR family transcriptional regulator